MENVMKIAIETYAKLTNTSFDKDKDYSHTYIRIIFYEQNTYPSYTTQSIEQVLPYTQNCNNSCWASGGKYTCKHYDTLTTDKC